MAEPLTEILSLFDKLSVRVTIRIFRSKPRNGIFGYHDLRSHEVARETIAGFCEWRRQRWTVDCPWTSGSTEGLLVLARLYMKKLH